MRKPLSLLPFALAVALIVDVGLGAVLGFWPSLAGLAVRWLCGR